MKNQAVLFILSIHVSLLQNSDLHLAGHGFPRDHNPSRQ